jgi:hypothetical protein
MSAPSFSLLSRFAEIETAQTTLRKAAIIATVRTSVEDVFHLYTIRDNPGPPHLLPVMAGLDPAIHV